MARKKASAKNPPVKRKRKEQPPKKDIVSEFGGWSLGDLAWGDKVGGGHVYGEIVQFYPKDSIAPCVSILDQVVGGYRVVRIDSLSEVKPKGIRTRVRISRK